MFKLICFLSVFIALSEDSTAFVVSKDNDNALKERPQKRLTGYPPPCDSRIYCHGPLLHTVQMAHLDHDSKTFSDQKMLHKPNIVLGNFDILMTKTNNNPTKEEVRKFVDENFGASGTELKMWIPSDWIESPEFLKKIKDPELRWYGKALNSVWKILGRELVPEVKDNEDMFSLIYVPNPVMVPGGRFKEFYYWDQYWILKGLLICDMIDSVRGMIENFLYMVDKLGYVPNGGRIYYTRSQPPMLIPMMKDYVEATGNWKFLKTHITTLDKEFRFWMANRTIVVEKDGKKFRLARHNCERTGPRPESYREDFELAETLLTQEDKDDLYINLKSGAETGWDYSSRWFISHDKSRAPLMKDIVTREIIPADLNGFIYNNARIMAQFHRRFKNHDRALYYDEVGDEWQNSINGVLWDEELGSWFDYEFVEGGLNTEFYPSNIVPLWANVSVNHDQKYTAKRIVDYLHNSGAMRYAGGIPTSMEQSGEQWDFPNGWAPLQHLVVDALDRAGAHYAPARFLAVELAQRWVINNYKAFKTSNNTMFEKYDVTSIGTPGGGGEYEIVEGFGWSNGVVLDFLNRFPNILTSIV